MQKIYLIILLLLLMLVAVFTLSNNQEVTVKFLVNSGWRTNVAALILVSMTVGAALMAVIDLVRGLHTWKDTKNLRKLLKMTEEERDLLKNRVEELSHPAAKPSDTKPSVINDEKK